MSTQPSSSSVRQPPRPFISFLILLLLVGAVGSSILLFTNFMSGNFGSNVQEEAPVTQVDTPAPEEPAEALAAPVAAPPAAEAKPATQDAPATVPPAVQEAPAAPALTQQTSATPVPVEPPPTPAPTAPVEVKQNRSLDDIEKNSAQPALAAASAVPATETPSAPAMSAPEAPVSSKAELDAFKQEVMARIDAADSRSYPEEMKSHARRSVRNLKYLQKLGVVSFTRNTEVADGGVSLNALRALLTSAEVEAQLKDRQRAGLIILGYADPTGAPDRNRALSLERAEFVKAAVKEVQPRVDRLIVLGLGQTTVLDKAQQKKNRAAEVWLAVEG